MACDSPVAKLRDGTGETRRIWARYAGPGSRQNSVIGSPKDSERGSLVTAARATSKHRPGQTHGKFFAENLATKSKEFGRPTAAECAVSTDRFHQICIAYQATKILLVQFSTTERFDDTLQV